MIIISYYSKNTPYEKVINTHLLPSLERLHLKYDIEGIGDLGSWQKNTHYKAVFIKKMLLKHKEPVVFLDADAVIKSYPKLLFELKDCDIALHKFDWLHFWHGKEGDNIQYLSGTLWLDYNEKVLKFLDNWILKNTKSAKWEQKNMQEVLESAPYKNTIKLYNLPPEYVAIMKANGTIPNWYVTKEPIIIHHQVSRKYKRR